MHPHGLRKRGDPIATGDAELNIRAVFMKFVQARGDLHTGSNDATLCAPGQGVVSSCALAGCMARRNVVCGA